MEVAEAEAVISVEVVEAVVVEEVVSIGLQNKGLLKKYELFFNFLVTFFIYKVFSINNYQLK